MKDLLLLLCRYPYDENKREHLYKLISEVSYWDQFINLINAHGIIALAAYNIKMAKLDNLVPADKMKILEDGFFQSMIRNTWLVNCWKEINTILSGAGISHVLLKGMALEHTLYESKGLRQMNDNDILLRKEDALKAWNLLQDNGFKSGMIKSALHKNILINIGKHLPTLYKNGYALEIHHSLFPEIKENAELMNDLRQFKIDGISAWQLSEKNQLKHLENHFAGHLKGGSIQLRQYADIILLDKNTSVIIPEAFILKPDRSGDSIFRKESFKSQFDSLPSNKKLRYLAGDIFPSFEWMRKRYNCSTIEALIHYPGRIGKLIWLIRKDGKWKNNRMLHPNTKFL